jgi:hypothetical protein
MFANKSAEIRAVHPDGSMPASIPHTRAGKLQALAAEGKPLTIPQSSCWPPAPFFCEGCLGAGCRREPIGRTGTTGTVRKVGPIALRTYLRAGKLRYWLASNLSRIFFGFIPVHRLQL